MSSKPILTVRDGASYPLERPRGTARASRRIVELAPEVNGKRLRQGRGAGLPFVTFS